MLAGTILCQPNFEGRRAGRRSIASSLWNCVHRTLLCSNTRKQLRRICIFCLWGFVLARASAGETLGEIFKYGNDPRQTEPRRSTEWNYQHAGLDWNGNDADGEEWLCPVGMKQSPVHLHVASVRAGGALLGHEQAAEFLDFRRVRSTGSNLKLENDGHTVKVSINDSEIQPQLILPIPDTGTLPADSLQLLPGQKLKKVNAAIEQIHFHTHSEHVLDGRLYPLEAHFVARINSSELASCGGAGCAIVTAVFWELADGSDVAEAPALASLWSQLPLHQEELKMLPKGQTVDLSELLPGNKSYLMYEGSLTTPPCTEGVLWLVMLQPLPLPQALLEKFLLAVGDSSCVLSPFGGPVPLRTSPAEPTSTSNSDSRTLPPSTTGTATDRPSNHVISGGGNITGEAPDAFVAGAPPRRLLMDEVQSSAVQGDLDPAATSPRITASTPETSVPGIRDPSASLSAGNDTSSPETSPTGDLDPAAGLSSNNTSSSDTNTMAGGTTDNPIEQNKKGSQRVRWECTKLGAGVNYRATQLWNDRQVRYWRDGNKASVQYVLGASALAGVVLGAAVTGGLVGVSSLLLVRNWRGNRALRRQSRTGAVLAVDRRASEVETTWLRGTPGATMA